MSVWKGLKSPCGVEFCGFCAGGLGINGELWCEDEWCGDEWWWEAEPSGDECSDGDWWGECCKLETPPYKGLHEPSRGGDIEPPLEFRVPLVFNNGDASSECGLQLALIGELCNGCCMVGERRKVDAIPGRASGLGLSGLGNGYWPRFPMLGGEVAGARGIPSEFPSEP